MKKMLVNYPACFYREKDGQYSVIFPDLNHLATAGKDLDEAMTMAVDCLAGYLYEAQLSGSKIQGPSKLKDVDVSSEYTEYEEAFVNLVAVDVGAYAREHFNKAVKKTLTIPKWLNDAAVKNNLNFSQILQNALKEKLEFK